MIEPLTREELVQDIIAVRKAMSHLRHDLHVAREVCWAARLSGQDAAITPSVILDIIGWPSESEGHPKGPNR